MNWPWSELGLSGPADLAAVRRAYAERLKTTHPEEDPEGFQRLHEAYQQARRMARQGGGPAEPQAREAPPPASGAEAGLQPQEPPPEAEGDWGFDRIFLQEARRRAEERELQAEKRRERFFAQYRPASEEEARRLAERFSRVEAALTIMEELSDSRASLREWVLFLHSGLFFSVKGDEDFVSALLEFLRRTPELEESVKHELAQAFGLRGREVPQVWQCLMEPLTGRACRPAPEPPAKKPLHKRRSVRIAAVFLLLLAAIPLAVRQIRELREAPGREARALMCQYLEEDMGRRMESHWNGQDAYENLYAPWDQPGLTFMAWADGERDPAAGKPGYTTNYGNVMLTEALEAFAERQGWELKRVQEGGCSGVMGAYGVSPGAYLLSVPLRGGEDGIAALGELMESLEEERWHQTAQPYQLRLVYQAIEWFAYTSGTAFDGEYLLDRYSKAGTDICVYLVEESGLAAVDFGGAPYRLKAQGTVELDGRSYFLVSGVDADAGEVVRQYLFSDLRLVSLPAERFSPDMRSYQVSGDLFQSDWENKPLALQILRKD